MEVGGQRHAPAALPLGMTRYPLYRTLGRPQGRSGRVLKISPPPGFDPRTVHLVASRYTDWAILAHLCKQWHVNFYHEGFSIVLAIPPALLSLWPLFCIFYILTSYMCGWCVSVMYSITHFLNQQMHRLFIIQYIFYSKISRNMFRFPILGPSSGTRNVNHTKSQINK
jgi:hypothetical protein